MIEYAGTAMTTLGDVGKLLPALGLGVAIEQILGNTQGSVVIGVAPETVFGNHGRGGRKALHSVYAVIQEIIDAENVVANRLHVAANRDPLEFLPSPNYHLRKQENNKPHQWSLAHS